MRTGTLHEAHTLQSSNSKYNSSHYVTHNIRIVDPDDPADTDADDAIGLAMHSSASSSSEMALNDFGVLDLPTSIPSNASSSSHTRSSSLSRAKSKFASIRRHFFPSGSSSPLSDDSSSFYSSSTTSNSADSTISLSTVTTVKSPPLSPSATAEYKPTETTIPIDEIHTHQGSFYYPPPPPPRSSTSAFKRLTLRSVASISRFNGSSKPQQPHQNTRSLSNRNSIISLSPATIPITALGGPAIAISPPDSPPAEVFRPSVCRLALKHAKSSLNSTPSAFPSQSSSSSLPKRPSTSPATSAAPRTLDQSSTYFMGRGTPRSLGPSNTRLAELRRETLLAAAKKKDGNLTTPEPLRADEIDHERLSVSWKDRTTRIAAAEKKARARAAKAEAASRVPVQANVLRCRATVAVAA